MKRCRSLRACVLQFALGWLAITLSSFSTAETLLVANKSAASVSLFELPSGALRATLPTGEGPHEVAVSPDGSRALVTNYGTRAGPGDSLTLIDIANAAVIATIPLPPGARPHGVTWIADTQALVTAEGLQQVLVVDTQEHRVLQQVAVDQDVVHMLTVDADSGKAFTANIGSGTSSVVSIDRGEKIADLESGAGTEGLALINGELWLSNRADDSVAVFDAASLELLERFTLKGFPIRVEADPARERIYITLPATDQLAVVDAPTRSVWRLLDFDIPIDSSRLTLLSDRLPDSSIPIGVLLSGDGQRLFVAHSASHVISIWSAEDLTFVGTIATGIEPDGMDWSPIEIQPK
ncbi:MAG: YncE family protein [Halieaceae bacterium]|nr:YncE family protein [Halieaceae bacterium]